MESDELHELRRIAFGRESTDEERAVAVEELRKLEIAQVAETRRTEARQAADESDVQRSLANEPNVAERSDSAPREIFPASDPSTPATEAVAPGSRRRTAVHAIWLVPIIIASLAVGAIGGSLWRVPQSSTTHASTTVPPTTEPSTTVPTAQADTPLGTDGSGQPGGDLAAADNHLAQLRTEGDAFPLPDVVQNLRQASVRFLGGTSDGVQLWVGLNTEDELCLLVYENASNSAAASCVTRANFVSHGITLGFNQYQTAWNGASFTIFKPYGS